MLRNCPGGAASRKNLSFLPQVFVVRRHRREQAIGIARGEFAAGFRIAGAHQDRPAAPPWLWFAEHGLELVVVAVEVERLILRPDAIDDLQPFLGIVVAAVVIAERDAHHAELDRIPARDDVEPEAAVADVVGRHHLLGGEHRIDEGDVERAERRDVLRSRRAVRTPRRWSRTWCPGYRSRPDSRASARSAAGIRGRLRRQACAALTLLSQEASQRSGALVRLKPPRQFMPNSPSLNLFLL